MIASNLLSYQSEYGGWPKNRDLTSAPFDGQPADLIGDLKPIFDNSATTDEVRFFARMYQATRDVRYLRALENGIDFILIAQYPTGGWPQSYPPDTQYHRHITFNDDAMVRIMELVKEVGNDEAFAMVDADRRSAARSAFQRGIECILKCQIVVNGKLTAWCAQHDELDYTPRPARRFELTSLSGGESVKIVQLLMSLERPSPEIVRAIEAAVSWLDSVRIEGWRVVEHPKEDGMGKNFEAIADPDAKAFWARFYDIATNQPLWSDIDGIARLGIHNIGWSRHGYAWTGTWAQSLLHRDLPAWRARLAENGMGEPAPKWEPKVRVALAGDSTVKDVGGWGFGFKKMLGADVLCENFAQGGQSSKSFRDTGVWKRTLDAKPDYVLIQFGHNDMPGKGPKRETDPSTTYSENLARFIDEVRQADAKPVLVTSLTRRIFAPDGTLNNELLPYVEAARNVAANHAVPIIDLHAMSRDLVVKLGPDGVEPFEPKLQPKPATEPKPAASTTAPAEAGAVTAPPASTAKQPASDIDFADPQTLVRDQSHLTVRGSLEFGRMVALELARVVPELAAIPVIKPQR